jgi:hypothetical protein
MIGYIQAEILGKVRGLKFGTLAAENITLKLVELGMETGNYSSAMIAEVIYWGLYNNSYVKREVMDFTFEQVCEWVDDNWRSNKELIRKITDVYQDSKYTKEYVEEVKVSMDDVKKKAGLTSPQDQDGESFGVGPLAD